MHNVFAKSAALLAALSTVACTDYLGSGGAPSAPTGLFYELQPSGDPVAPAGIILRWDASNDQDIDCVQPRCVPILRPAVCGRVIFRLARGGVHAEHPDSRGARTLGRGSGMILPWYWACRRLSRPACAIFLKHTTAKVCQRG